MKVHHVKTLREPTITVPSANGKITYASRPYMKFTIAARNGASPGGMPIEKFTADVSVQTSGDEISIPTDRVTIKSKTKIEQLTSDAVASIPILSSSDSSWCTAGETNVCRAYGGVNISDSTTRWVYGSNSDGLTVETSSMYEANNARTFKYANIIAARTSGEKITAANWNSLNTAETNHNQYCKAADGTSYAVTAGDPISHNSMNNLNSKIKTSNDVFGITTSYTTVAKGDEIKAGAFNTARSNIMKC